ncbi:hypothetical protein TWF281_001663 [Arthrobotrys megalospora]
MTLSEVFLLKDPQVRKRIEDWRWQIDQASCKVSEREKQSQQSQRFLKRRCTSAPPGDSETSAKFLTPPGSRPNISDNGGDHFDTERTSRRQNKRTRPITEEVEVEEEERDSFSLSAPPSVHSRASSRSNASRKGTSRRSSASTDNSQHK